MLRNVNLDDVATYIRLRCDPGMMAHLGGPQDPSDMPAKVRSDALLAASDTAWIQMICPGEDPGEIAGTVTLWAHEEGSPPISEIGWMVLAKYQAKGLAKQAVTEVLRRAAKDGRWGRIHAFPPVTNIPSNRLCAGLGFAPLGEMDFTFAGHVLRVRKWASDPPYFGADSP